MTTNHTKATNHLKRVCPAIAEVIRRVGPCKLEVHSSRSPFEALVSAVAHQQLHGKAAATILGRFYALFPRQQFPTPSQLAKVTDDDLRGVGFSRAKVAALRDIAAHTLSGTVPSPEEIPTLSDEEIIARLVQVRGVGKWTVEMLLIFTLGRPDVWPIDDFGIRTGYKVAHNLTEMPKPKELLPLGDLYRPHRSVASWYLWRASELGKTTANAAP